ncbi:hypothetical protein B0H13DRAFT_1926282 [Mycena leptocephala]|nr:hypothetical protein B0H13DRAFT_1926282 [Mycena leptocephala]
MGINGAKEWNLSLLLRSCRPRSVGSSLPSHPSSSGYKVLPRTRARSPPRNLVRPLSRSPEKSISAKRFHGHPPDDKPFIVIGPVDTTASVAPLTILRIYMDARLPNFANHLRVIMPAADLRALKKAWDDKGYNSSGTVRMVATGGNETMASAASASRSGTGGGGYGRHFQAGSGNSGRSSSYRA